MSVRCRVGSVVRCGRALTLRARVEPRTVARAVRGAPDSDARVAVDAPDPGPVHEYVGCIRPGMGLRARTALAAAARSRGLETPHDDALAAAREQLAELAVDSGDGRARLREQVAATADEAERLRESAAAARGRLQERREQGLDPTPAAEQLAAAVEDLSEAETAGAAARQRLATLRERARERRDTRERRLRLEDRVANLERRARAHLREQVRGEYVAALSAVPGAGDPDEPFEADPVTGALAVARVAEIDAPVVLACDRFDGAEEAAAWLDGPVIRVPDG